MPVQSSIRRQLLDVLCATLANSVDGIARVERCLFHGVSAKLLPALAVFPVDEAKTPMAHSGSTQRLFNVRIVYVAGKSEEDLSASLDQLIDSALVQIEQAIVADGTLGGLAFQVNLLRWTWQLESGEIPFIGAWADVEIEYHTLEDPTISDR